MKSVSPEGMTYLVRDPSVWHGYAHLCLTRTGRLIMSYKQAYGHGASRWDKVFVTHSDDRGRTWAQAQLLDEGDFANKGFLVACGGTYITALRSGRIILDYGLESWPFRDDTVDQMRISDDDGNTWSERVPMSTSGRLYLMGSLTELKDGTLIAFAGPHNKIVRSTDAGMTWEWSDWTMTEETAFGAGMEHCICDLGDGRLIMFMREGSAMNLPAHKMISEDNGLTWSKPQPTPFIGGHWPSCFRLQDGRYIIAYRNLGGRANSVVWCGDPSRLPGYQVSSCRYENAEPTDSLTDEGLVIDNDGAKRQFTQFYLFPPDDNLATVNIEAELRCLSNAGYGCAIGIRRCGWLRIFPDHIDIEHIPGDSVRKLDATQWHKYRFERRDLTMRVFVDDKEVFAVPSLELAPPHVAPFNAFGNMFDYPAWEERHHYPTRVRLLKQVQPSNSGKSIWRSVKMDITKNKWLPDYHYEWISARDGIPDRWQEENLLELDYCQDANDWGKPVVVAWPDGECFAADYFCNGMPVGVVSHARLRPGRGHNNYVAGFRFRVDDIPSGK